MYVQLYVRKNKMAASNKKVLQKQRQIFNNSYLTSDPKIRLTN